MTANATGKLRRSFAIAGAAVVLPLLAVFLSNSLWGYLPLSRDVSRVPYFVHVTNAMRDLEVAVLRSALVAHANILSSGDDATVHAGVTLDETFDDVKRTFSTVQRAVGEWPDVQERTLLVYSRWLVIREQARALVEGPEAADVAAASPGGSMNDAAAIGLRTRTLPPATVEEFDANVTSAVSDIERMIKEVSTDVNARLLEGRLSSQRIYGLTVAVGLMVIMFIMYVNIRLARYVVDPVNGIVGSMTKFRDGDYTARTGVRRRDEIGALANAFNEMAEDIEQTHEHLSSLSERDPLTGMLNRRGFDPRFERHLQHADAAGHEVAVIMVDIDHFKKVNDTYGHACGDQVLVAVADTIRNCLRAGDFSARFGGEEFVICMPGEGRETGLVVAERIREAVARLPLYDMDGTAFSVTMSAGVATYPDCGDAGKDVLQAGDEALYTAKTAGRNRVEFACADAPAAPLRKAG